jgi:hypothetical protein|tara:strand:+ start:400 stop:618 length:219 start_codon:yes stop_codon:yes gene_type:complete
MENTTKTAAQNEAIQDINMEFIDNDICAKFQTMETQFWMDLLKEADDQGFCWAKVDVEIKFKATKIKTALGL